MRSSGFTDITYIFISVCSAVIGMRMHGSLFWAIMDFCFWPLAWLKWLLYQEVSMTIIKQSFDFLFK